MMEYGRTISLFRANAQQRLFLTEQYLNPTNDQVVISAIDEHLYRQYRYITLY